MRRREFIQSAASVTAMAAFSTRADAAAAPKAIKEPAGVELAVATICTDGFANRQHEPAFRMIPQTGFRNVEFNVWYADLLTPGYMRSIQERSAKSGLKPVCLQGSSFGGQGKGGVLKDVAHKLWLLQSARELGCQRVKCTGAARGTQGGLEAVIEICREVGPAAQEMGMLLLLENHVKNVLKNIADYDAIFSKIDSPHVGLCLDTGHFEGAGIQLSDVVERFHSRTLHVDLKDCKAFGQGHDTVVFGEGVTDFDAFLQQLFSHEYRGYLVVEQAWAQPKEPVLENLRSAYHKFKKYERR